MSVAPVSPASVTGPNTNQSFFSSILSPFTSIGTSIGSGISKALGIAPTEADFRSLNPTVKTVNSPAQAVAATQINAANSLGVNLKTATTAQMTQVNAKAEEFLRVGGYSGGMLLSPVDRASAVTALAGNNATDTAAAAKKESVAGSIFGFLGQAIGAVAPTLIQTGLAQYQAKNDPTIRAQRSAMEQEFQLAQQQMASQLEMNKQMTAFQQQQLQAQTELEKARIQAQLDATKASFASYPTSVAPAVPTVNGVSVPTDGVMGVATTPNQANAGLTSLLASLLNPPAQSYSVAPVGGSILTPLAAAEYAQAQQVQPAPKSNLMPLLLFGGLAVGTIYFLSRKKK